MFNPDRIQHATVSSGWDQTELPIKLALKGKYTTSFWEINSFFLWSKCQMYICFKYYKTSHEETIVTYFRKCSCTVKAGIKM
jgi:hypothetical protein